MDYLPGATSPNGCTRKGRSLPRGPTTGRRAAWMPSPPPTARASSTATSSRRTCCSTRPAIRTSPTSASPCTATPRRVSPPGWSWARRLHVPRQARGDDATSASDVFSLGATLLYAATGAGPFGTGDPGCCCCGPLQVGPRRHRRPFPPISAAAASTPCSPRTHRRRPSAAEARGAAPPRNRTARSCAAPGRSATVGDPRRRCAPILLVAGGLAILAGGDGNEGRLSGSRSDARTTDPTTTASTTEPCTPLATSRVANGPRPTPMARRASTGSTTTTARSPMAAKPRPTTSSPTPRSRARCSPTSSRPTTRTATCCRCPTSSSSTAAARSTSPHGPGRRQPTGHRARRHRRTGHA